MHALLTGLIADLRRRLYSLSRPSRRLNARRLRRRGESLDAILCRDAVASDIPELAELHVALWNATYRKQGPSVATRTAQWEAVFRRADPHSFVLVLEDHNTRIIGFAFGERGDGSFEGVLNKIYLRWEYHGLGLGRRMMAESARRFLERGIHSFLLFAERSNPSIGFYDRMGGERLLDERGVFMGAFGWKDVRPLLGSTAIDNGSGMPGWGLNPPGT
jgi:ribosomal protein S18 acetylase RimI-like enzyme